MTEHSMPTGTYDVKFFRQQGWYDGYVTGKRKPRHSIGSWQYYHYEEGFKEGEEKRMKEDAHSIIRTA